MRCREAKSRLIAFQRANSARIDDRELLDHLKNCPACAQNAMAITTLRQMLIAASENDSSEILPLSVQRQRVEAQMKPGEHSITRHISLRIIRNNLIGRKPLFRIGVVIAIATLVVMTLVPFKYDRIVGYEIAFAGICPELVEEDNILCDMLYTMGLAEVDVDILGCDTTCNLLVYHLESHEDAQYVVSTFSEINAIDLSAEIIPVLTSTHGSLLAQVNERLRRIE